MPLRSVRRLPARVPHPVRLPRRGPRAALLAVLVSTLASVLVGGTARSAGTGPSLAVPAYFWSPTQWATMGAASPSVRLIVANVSDGPGWSRDDAQAQIFASAGPSARLVGYVNSAYGGVPMDELILQIDRWRAWYGISSVFLDQVPADCTRSNYYASAAMVVRSHGGTVVLNPGGAVASCMAASADVIVAFEGPASAYATWTPPGWMQNVSAPTFWHIVYAASSAELSSVIDSATRRGATYLYATPDTPPNPFDVLPTGAYWTTLVALGTPTATTGPSTTSPSVTTSISIGTAAPSPVSVTPFSTTSTTTTSVAVVASTVGGFGAGVITTPAAPSTTAVPTTTAPATSRPVATTTTIRVRTTTTRKRIVTTTTTTRPRRVVRTTTRKRVAVHTTTRKRSAG